MRESSCDHLERFTIDAVDSLCAKGPLADSTACRDIARILASSRAYTPQTQTLHFESMLAARSWSNASQRWTYESGDVRGQMRSDEALLQDSYVRHWFFLRFGPLSTSKHWHSLTVHNVLPAFGRTTLMTSRVIAATDDRGEIYSNPPIHIHHSLHIIADAYPSNGNPTAGDISVCEAEGKACFMEQYPIGYGQLIDSPLSAEVLVHSPSNRISHFYCLLAYEMQDHGKPLGFYHVFQPPSMHLPALNFLAPAGMWLKWFRWQWPDSGRVLAIYLHSHWSMGSSFSLLFSAHPKELGLLNMPLTDGDVLESNMQDQQELLNRILLQTQRNTSDVEIKCLQRSPGSISIGAHKYDRRAEFPCADPFVFNAGRTATLLTFATYCNAVPQHLHLDIQFFPLGNGSHPDQMIFGYDTHLWEPTQHL